MSWETSHFRENLSRETSILGECLSWEKKTCLEGPLFWEKTCLGRALFWENLSWETSICGWKSVKIDCSLGSHLAICAMLIDVLCSLTSRRNNSSWSTSPVLSSIYRRTQVEEPRRRHHQNGVTWPSTVGQADKTRWKCTAIITQNRPTCIFFIDCQSGSLASASPATFFDPASAGSHSTCIHTGWYGYCTNHRRRLVCLVTPVALSPNRSRPRVLWQKPAPSFF